MNFFFIAVLFFYNFMFIKNGEIKMEQCFFFQFELGKFKKKKFFQREKSFKQSFLESK